MRRFWLACTMVIVVGISSCVDSDKDLYQEAPGVEINTSNFSTIQKVQVEIDCSNSESRVPFSIYDGNPLIEGENTIILKENEKDFTVASGADKFTRESNAIILTDNVKTNPNAEYKVTFKYGDKNSNKKQETSIDAFIYRPSKEGNRLEVHCPMKKPTSKVDTSLFGQYEDCSKPNEGIYYVSNQENIYPFAFYLSNANANDIAELKNFDKNEKKSISEIYPKFIDWAKYGTNADWYKKK